MDRCGYGTKATAFTAHCLISSYRTAGSLISSPRFKQEVFGQNVCHKCSIDMEKKTQQPTFTTSSLVGNIILCCAEQNESMCSFWERSTLRQEDPFQLLASDDF